MSKNGVMRGPATTRLPLPSHPAAALTFCPALDVSFWSVVFSRPHKKTARERAVEVGKATVGLVVAFLLDDRLFFFGMRHRKYVDVISFFDDGLAAIAVVLLNDRRVLCFHG
jgi:hypothetical protein